QAAQPDLVLEFREQGFHLLSLSLCLRELGRLRPPAPPVNVPEAFTSIAEPEFANVEPLRDEGFVREFEDAPELALGPIPEVVLAHAADIDEGEKVWVLSTPDI